MQSEEVHNIIQIHNNVLWDWQYFVEYSLYGMMDMNIVMDLSNVM